MGRPQNQRSKYSEISNDEQRKHRRVAKRNTPGLQLYHRIAVVPPHRVDVVYPPLEVTASVCVCSSYETVLSTRRQPAHPESALILNPTERDTSSVVTKLRLRQLRCKPQQYN